MGPAERDDQASIRDWLATWGQCVAAVDFARARTLFHKQVVGFGTYSDFVAGLDDLEAQQWRQVWPTIRDFRFDVEGLSSGTSPDRLLGYLAARWSSTGITSAVAGRTICRIFAERSSP